MKNLASRLSAQAILALLSLIIIVPLFFLINTALKTQKEFLKSPLSFVGEVHWQNFADAWQLGQLDIYFKNSLIYAVGTVVATCAIGLMAAYPISRRHFRGSNLAYLIFLSALFLPVGLVPTLYMMKILHLSNTYHGFIALQTAYNLPFAVFVFVGFIGSVPRELDEAALIDGCGYVRFIFMILAPVMRPALATVAIFTAIGSWNDFINPYIFLTDQNLRPLTAGVYIFVGQYVSNWPMLCASVILVVIPIMIAYIFAQRYIIAGLTSGAVKG